LRRKVSETGGHLVSETRGHFFVTRLSLADRKDKSKRATLVPWYVHGDKEVKPQHLAVYVAIASQLFRGKNIVRLGLRWIAKNANVNKDTASACIAKLVELGHLEVVSETGLGRSATYKVTGWQFATKQKAQPSDRVVCVQCGRPQDPRQINAVGICHGCGDKGRALIEVRQLLEERGFIATAGEVWSELYAGGSKCSRRAINQAYIELMDKQHSTPIANRQ
jgi:hypothetical protein